MKTRAWLSMAVLLGLVATGCQGLGGAAPTVAPTNAPTQAVTQAPPASATPTAASPAPSATPSPAVDPATVPAPGDVRPPSASMTVGDQAQEAGIGTYCWNDNPAGGQGIGLCVDMIGIMTPLEPLVLPAGEFTAQFHLPLETAPTTAVLEVMPSTGQSTPIEGQNIQAWQPQPGERLDVPLEVEPSVALNLEPGLHILALFAQWEGIGDVMYGFLVQVGESGGGPAFTLPASCLPGDQSLAPYVDPGGRYCLLFPNHFRIGDVTLDRTNFYGPPLDQSLEPLFASLALQVEGAANGRGLSQVVDEFVQANAQGLPVTRRPITLGGEPAEVVEGVPGRLLSWQVFVIHADTVYHLSLFPMDPGVPQVEPDTQAVWQAVSTSLTFMGQ